MKLNMAKDKTKQNLKDNKNRIWEFLGSLWILVQFGTFLILADLLLDKDQNLILRKKKDT